MTETICSVAGCDRTTHTPGMAMCQAHRRRVRLTGNPGTEPIKTYGLPKPPCSVDNCHEPAKSKGMCNKHFSRQGRYGDTTTVKPTPTGPANGRWQGDQVGYLGAHRRVLRLRGPATDHPCRSCGNPAKHWAYDHQDPNQKWGNIHGWLMPYSLDPDHYTPMCQSCHRTFDNAARRKVTMSA